MPLRVFILSVLNKRSGITDDDMPNIEMDDHQICEAKNHHAYFRYYMDVEEAFFGFMYYVRIVSSRALCSSQG